MPWAIEDEQVVVRQGGGCLACVFLPTVLLGVLFAAGGALHALRLAGLAGGVGHPGAAVLAGGGGLAMLLFGLLGLLGRSEVWVDPVARQVRTRTRLIAWHLERAYPFDAFERVAVRGGRSRHSKFHFACLEGRRSLALERSTLADARALAEELARSMGLPLQD